MARRLSIACLQTCPKATIGEAIDEALPIAEEAVEAGADILFLPEYCSGLVSEEGVLKPPAAPEADHPMVSLFQQFARRTKVCVSLGSVAVSTASDKLINRAIMINADGKIISRYDKIHLFDVQISPNEIYRESATVIAGDNASIINFDHVKLAHVICYDLRFPVFCRNNDDYDLLICVANWPEARIQAWDTLLSARAIENMAYTIGVNRVGRDAYRLQYPGHSAIYNAMGDREGFLDKEQTIAYIVIDKSKLETTREKLPFLQDRDEFTLT